MPAPRTTIIRPEAAEQDAMRTRAQIHLQNITATAVHDLKITGAPFVVMGVVIWGAELSELDQRAAANMFAAIGTIYDPTTTERQKQAAANQAPQIRCQNFRGAQFSNAAHHRARITWPPA